MIDEALVGLFRDAGERYVSGEELARRLSVSRTTIWNRIRALIAEGYRFRASPRLGYRLVFAPDRLHAEELRAGLATRRIGRTIVVHGEVDSTNDLAAELAAAGEPEGVVVLAEHQRKGRGRFHRTWFCPPYEGILMSVVLRPPFHPREAGRIVIVSAVAVARALRTVCGLEAMIKWPNDVQVRGRKMAGILIEMNAEAEVIHWAVVGIGVNVNLTEGDIPKSLRGKCTSVRIETGQTASRAELARALLKELDGRYDVLLHEGFEPIRSEWDFHSASLGQRVQVEWRGEVWVGRHQGLDEDGSLLLRLDNGIVQKLSAGDLTVLTAAEPPRS